MSKRIIFLLFFSVIRLIPFFTPHIIAADEYKKEKAIYSIAPLAGRGEYSDLGIIDLEGKKVKLTVFKTNVLGFKDTETIYSDAQNFLPIRVVRDIAWWLGRETIIEEYDQQLFTVTIKKFKGNKKIQESVLKSDGPIYNAILVPFYLRKVTGLRIGWSFTFHLPNKFIAKLVSLDNIKVAGRKFQAYHFSSIPDKFEIWISNDNLRIPLKIKGRGGLNYTLVLKQYFSGKDNF